MDIVNKIEQPVKNYIKQVSDAKYGDELPIVCHNNNDILLNMFYDDSDSNNIKLSNNSIKYNKLLKKKIPYKNNEHRWYGAKYLHVNYIITENYIRLIISKITGVIHKKIDITGLSINVDNPKFKQFHKKISSKFDISDIDLTKFEFFTELRLSSKHGFQVFQDYKTNPNGIIYYDENNIISKKKSKKKKEKIEFKITDDIIIEKLKKPPSKYQDILPSNTGYNYENEPDSELTKSLITSHIKYLTMKSFVSDTNFHKFISDVYDLNPGSYGSYVEKRVIAELGVKNVLASLDRGDFVDDIDKYYEIKTSYTTKDEKWSILHIRNYQKYDYMIIVLVDVLNNCNYNFLLIEKKWLTKKTFKSISYQNGTKKTNSKNKEVELRLSIGRKEIEKLLKFNLLYDTSLDSLKKYFKNNKLSQPKINN